MAFREVRVFEVREVLRLWLRGETLRGIERLSRVDRKTVRRYVEAAVLLVTCNAQPYSKHDWHWRIIVAHRFGHAAAAPAVRAAMKLLDDAGLEVRVLVLDANPHLGERAHEVGIPHAKLSG